MSLPSSKAGVQQSIRSFFSAPKAPQYAPPPSSSTTAVPPPPAAAAAPPPRSSQSSPLPLLPISPPVTSSTNPSLPREATIRAIEPDDVPALRRLNSLLLPVAFPDSFYAAALDPAQSHRYSRVITWRGDGNGLPEEPKIVGAVVCIPEADKSSTDSAPTTLYIRSLGLLAPYRALGLANAALDDILSAITASTPLRNVTAHVWTENEEGLAWYLRRGFERIGAPIEGYYRRLRPDSAILVSRPIRANVLRAVHAHNGTTPTPSAPQKQVAPSATAAIINRPPPPTSATLNSDARPPPRGGGSYQTQRSDMEWNDLPVDMMGLPRPSRRTLVAGGGNSEPASSGAASGASSRSSSSAAQKKKRDRSYPAAAFGS